jgi:hypothetical protein
MAGLSDLDFQPVLDFQSQVLAHFGASVSPLSSSSSFSLVASFSCSAIRLDVDSVGLILQSCVGGTTRDFNVTWLKDWSFCFQVSGKSVGIMIHHLRSYVGRHFSVHFALCRNGGPDWRRELTKWEMLQDAEWHQVSRRKKSFAAAVREQRRPRLSRGSGAARQSSVFKRLRDHDYF